MFSGLEVRNRLEERFLGALVALHAGVGLAVLDRGDAHFLAGPAVRLVERGQLFADARADVVGIHADIGHLRAVLVIDVVVDGDERDARGLGLLRR